MASTYCGLGAARLNCAQSDERRVDCARAILPLFVARHAMNRYKTRKFPLFVVDFVVLSYKTRTIHTIRNIGFLLIVVTNAFR